MKKILIVLLPMIAQAMGHFGQGGGEYSEEHARWGMRRILVGVPLLAAGLFCLAKADVREEALGRCWAQPSLAGASLECEVGVLTYKALGALGIGIGGCTAGVCGCLEGLIASRICCEPDCWKKMGMACCEECCTMGDWCLPRLSRRVVNGLGIAASVACLGLGSKLMYDVGAQPAGFDRYVRHMAGIGGTAIGGLCCWQFCQDCCECEALRMLEILRMHED